MTASNRKKMARAIRSPSPVGPFAGWEIVMIPVGESAVKFQPIVLNYGTWAEARRVIGETRFFVLAEPNGHLPRVLVTGVDALDGIRKPLPAPAHVWKWGSPPSKAIVKKSGFYLENGQAMETGEFIFRLKCSKEE